MDETGLFVDDPGDYDIVRHPEYPFIHCTRDRRCESGNEFVPLELKAVSGFEGNQWKDGQTPLKHEIQLQHQMLVTGSSHGFVAALIGLADFQYRRIERDDEFIETLVSKIKQFWHFVETKTQPPIDYSIGTRRALERIYPADNGKVTFLPDAAEQIHLNRLDAIARLKDAERDKLHAENQLRSLIGDNERGVLPDKSSYTWKTQTRKASVKVTRVEKKSYRVLRYSKRKTRRDRSEEEIMAILDKPF